MRTPQAVIKASKRIVDMRTNKVTHLGEYKGYEAFTIESLESVPIPTGLPLVFLYKEGEDVISVNPDSVFDVMDEIVKNKKI